MYIVLQKKRFTKVITYDNFKGEGDIIYKVEFYKEKNGNSGQRIGAGKKIYGRL